MGNAAPQLGSRGVNGGERTSLAIYHLSPGPSRTVNTQCPAHAGWVNPFRGCLGGSLCRPCPGYSRRMLVLLPFPVSAPKLGAMLLLQEVPWFPKENRVFPFFQFCLGFFLCLGCSGGSACGQAGWTARGRLRPAAHHSSEGDEPQHCLRRRAGNGGGGGCSTKL